MDQEKKLKIEEAIEASQSKGNQRLTEALVEALENVQTEEAFPKAA